MTEQTVPDWPAYAERLAERLTTAGAVRTDTWRKVLARVPRHVFVPRFYEQTEEGAWAVVDGAGTAQRDRWLDAVYSDTTLVTALADVPLPPPYDNQRFQVAVSSSTMPALMVRMLETLRLRDGQRVLEIGTGTGYNVALLSERLGDAQVASVDIDPDLVDAARARLAAAGYRPHLAAGDGTRGLPAHGRYDAILATCAVPAIPTAWIDQLSEGGTILVDVHGNISGNLALLHRTDNRVTGRFCAGYGSFMPARHALTVRPEPASAAGQGTGTERFTKVPPSIVHEQHKPAAMLVQLHLPAGTELRRTVDENQTVATRLVAPDGSWCQVAEQPGADGRYPVSAHGPRDLWRDAEDAHALYQRLNAPDWTRFGITADTVGQRVWLDDQDKYSWLLPL